MIEKERDALAEEMAVEVARLRAERNVLKARVAELESKLYVQNISQSMSIDNAVDAFAKAANERDALKARVADLEEENSNLRDIVEHTHGDPTNA